MRFALFSDVHGNLTGLKAVLAQLDQHTAESGPFDAVFCLGDMIGGGPGVDEVFDLLIARQVHMVMGNHDLLEIDFENQIKRVPPEWTAFMHRVQAWIAPRLSPAYREWIASLPLVERIEAAPGQTLAVCHAAPNDPWGLVCRPDEPADRLDAVFGPLNAQVVAYGHFHQHHVITHNGMLLVNVASVGLRNDGRSAYTLLEFTAGRWVVRQFQVAYDIHEEARLMRENEVPVP